jgi:hypothetical protein
MRHQGFFNIFISKGLPLVILTSGGAFGLSYFLAGKLETKEQYTQVKSTTTREFELQEERTKLMKRLVKDDNPENDFSKRIERPD